MRRFIVAFTIASLITCAKSNAERAAAIAAPPIHGEPDYAPWNRILAAYYDPDRGMDYAALKSRDATALAQIRQTLARLDAGSLTQKQQLAYWINLYNVNVVGVVIDHYPVRSIRDISTDPIIRLNVFKKALVPFGGSAIALNDIENQHLRERFHDPRIHFAINCAARSCPPIRREAYTGAAVDQQLDDQVRRFAAGPGLRVERNGTSTVVHTTKVMDWFKEDFDKWGGGALAFLRKYLPPQKAQLLTSSGDIKIEYDGYDWSLNDWKR